MIVECKKCEALVDAKVLKDYQGFEPEGPPYKYSFLNCPKCNNPFLVVQEDFGNGWDDPYRLYPLKTNMSNIERDKKRKRRKNRANNPLQRMAYSHR